MLRTIERSSQLLKLFTIENPEWGITELASALGWSTSTTHDLAASLCQIGLLRQSGKRRYRVGWRVLELSHVILGSSTLQTEARKEMERFASQYDESILLGVLAGGKILFADKIIAKQPLPIAFSTQHGRFWAHCTAAGKVIMAHLPQEERQKIVDEHGLESMTSKSIRSIETLNEELEQIRRQGHAYAFEESMIGLGCVGAPLFDDSGKVVAAIAIAADIRRFERHLDQFRSAVVGTANRVSTRLGHIDFIG